MSEPNPPGNAAAAATLFDDEDVEKDVAKDGEASPDDTLTAGENTEIEKQVAAIIEANVGRPPAERISVDPQEVS